MVRLPWTLSSTLTRQKSCQPVGVMLPLAQGRITFLLCDPQSTQRGTCGLTAVCPDLLPSGWPAGPKLPRRTCTKQPRPSRNAWQKFQAKLAVCCARQPGGEFTVTCGSTAARGSETFLCHHKRQCPGRYAAAGRQSGTAWSLDIKWLRLAVHALAQQSTQSFVACADAFPGQAYTPGQHERGRSPPCLVKRRGNIH